MNADFDVAAVNYDLEFTDSQTGRLQRNKIWKLLDSIIGRSQRLNVLELNCGTGEDAQYLESKGHNVLATDVSEKMLERARIKNRSNSVEFKSLDLNDIQSHSFDKKFDIVFSNFGGLNCVDGNSISHILKTIENLLVSDGRFIAVVMPKMCIWELIYFLLKGQVKSAYRRRNGYVKANVSGVEVETWYYNPGNLIEISGSSLEQRMVRPVGLFLPPSYMEGFFKNKPVYLKVLSFLENLFARFSWQAAKSDHYYIEFVKK